MEKYDAIVVGLGAMGSAAAWQLARRGRRVLGLEAHAPGHTLGSSHGESRIIRMAYMEHPDYVPLLRRAYELWRETEERAGEDLMRLTGGLFAGPPEGHVVAGSLASARAHGLPHELLDAGEIHRRFPALRPLEGDVAVWEETAGVLFAERCVVAQLRLAEASGARLRHGEPVLGWEPSGDGYEVTTPGGRYGADSLVLAAGAWLPRFLDGLGLPLQPERIPVYWLQPTDTPELFDPARFPVYIWDTGGPRTYYGFPHLGWPGVKVGRHHSGERCDPDTVGREVTGADEAAVREFVRGRIPALDGPVAAGVVCLYTNTPDEHFVVDRHPQLPGVVYAAACSGHGFKFASVMGEVLADLLTEGRATPAAGFLRAERLGVGAAAGRAEG
jgi:sarcosine oxidase